MYGIEVNRGGATVVFAGLAVAMLTGDRLAGFRAELREVASLTVSLSNREKCLFLQNKLFFSRGPNYSTHFGETGIFPAPILMDLYHTPGMAT
jgi:hypothetical protein